MVKIEDVRSALWIRSWAILGKPDMIEAAFERGSGEQIIDGFVAEPELVGRNAWRDHRSATFIN